MDDRIQRIVDKARSGDIIPSDISDPLGGDDGAETDSEGNEELADGDEDTMAASLRDRLNAAIPLGDDDDDDDDDEEADDVVDQPAVEEDEETEGEAEDVEGEGDQSFLDRIEEAVPGLGDDDDDGDEESEVVGSSPYSGDFVDRVAYSLFGELFRGAEDTYSEFNRTLNQARIPVSYDVYLSRVMLYGVIASLMGIFMGVTVTFLLADILLALGVDVQVPAEVAEFLQSNALLIRGFLITGFLTIVLFTMVVGSLYYWPYYVASERGRKIDGMLPHAVTYCYAMSRGGVSILDVMRSLAEAEDTYGEVSKEFAAIINNVEYVQEDLRTAVREEATITPSDDLQDFLEDLLSVIDSGSDMESFFYNKSQLYNQRRSDSQEQTLEVLELMSEMYVTLFVASPIFILVVLLVMSLMGGANMMYLYAMTYFGLPMGAVFFILMVKIINMSVDAGGEELERSYMDGVPEPDLSSDIEDDPRYKRYKREQYRQTFWSYILAPAYKVREEPLFTAVFTVPLAALFIAYAHTSGLAPIAPESFTEQPVWASAILVLVPFYIIGIPMSLVYEVNQRRESSILKKLPEAFKSAADANGRGIGLEESFWMVAENTDGELSKELRHAFYQAQWTGNLGDSLSAMANKIRVPRLSRTLKLITEANSTSGDIQSVLQVAAQDVENMHQLDKDRAQNAMMYLVIISVAFLIALGVIAMLDMAFLSAIADSMGGEDMDGGGPDGGGGAGGMGGQGFGDIPIMKFRMAFLHTCMVLGFTAGLVSGTMANGNALSGLKYALVMMGIAVAVFAFV